MGSTTPTSRSRRSHLNLHELNLSIAPLSSKYPLDASAPPSPSGETLHTPRTSYIAQKSAPTTPGILSLSQSRSNSRNGRRNPSKPYAYDGYFINPDHPVRDDGEIPKAKSTTTMLPGVSFVDQPSKGRHHTRKGTAPLPLRKPLHRHHTSDTTDGWFHRAGIAIAGETRDSKGQGWLIRRESSTSLVQSADDYDDEAKARHVALLSGESLNNADYDTPFTPRLSRAGSRMQSRLHSRMGSRIHSARQSRRGSTAGSRVDLVMSARSKASSARHSLELDESMFERDQIEPDFIEADEEGDDDEEEVARLARERGFGLGTWVDKLIGWSLFSVDEDGEDSSSEDDDEEEDESMRPENMTKEEFRLRREVEAKRRKLEREAIIAASAVHAHDKDTATDDEAENKPPPPGEEGGGWADAAWLFTVASKVIL
ncbi:unnamed protein product [Periconia digitata]|uniref:Uncharacterized protein n=1 Tax=Periconia digitata TaxID=1303443 RepID=A0A9W4UPH3_9PLEO|nr:unnamed protein product [Periconia digitata]